MNFLTRSLTSYVSHSSRPSRRCLFLLRPVAAQSSMYSSVYQITDPLPRAKSPSPSTLPSPSSSWSLSRGEKVKKQGESVIDFQRPSEIPYQAKVANLVNLIGQITTPVEFHYTPGGKPLAGAVISQENDNPLVIPVVFEGDLANVAATHVKLNNCVYVVGRLSEDPLPFVLGECQGNFHLVAENINFVEGFPVKKKASASAGAGKANSFPKKRIFKDENDASEPKISQANLKSADTEKNGNGDTANDHWRDLVKNPSQWRDYREQKVNGSVKAKHPDFKHKDSAIPLWLNNAPAWVLQELGNGGKPEQKKVNVVEGEEAWKNLVENPSKWWDNRVGKRNAKAPDFKHKETGEALWLNRSPTWVFSKLPPLKEPVK